MELLPNEIIASRCEWFLAGNALTSPVTIFPMSRDYHIEALSELGKFFLSFLTAALFTTYSTMTQCALNTAHLPDYTQGVISSSQLICQVLQRRRRP